MNAKNYLIRYYSIAGVVVSLFTALMTYWVIGVPIGKIMAFKIFLIVLVTLPVIGILSYAIGGCLSGRLATISEYLNNINEDKFLIQKHQEEITDLNAIHESIYGLSCRLESSISSLKQTNNQLNTMLLALSHDIKTPLAIIDGYLEEMEDDIIKPLNKPRIVGVMRQEVAYMNELSTDVIEYLQSLEPVCKKTTILLKDFLYTEICHLVCVDKKVVLQCHVKDDLAVEFDRVALKSILLNLLHNASKYTKSGSITVDAQDKRIVIEDTGVGIQNENVEKIFEPFYCEDASKNRETCGFGLGLSIAKNLAQHNGYTLFLDTEYTQGCRFVLEEA